MCFGVCVALLCPPPLPPPPETATQRDQRQRNDDAFPHPGDRIPRPLVASPSLSPPAVKSPPVRSYRDLRVWQDAMDLAEETYRATETFPHHERYGLVTQLRRAAVSVASNIAEGNARSTGDYLRHLLVSSGSLTEMETQFMLSNRLGFLPPEHAKPLLEKCDQLGRMLGGLRKSLRARRARPPSPESRAPSP